MLLQSRTLRPERPSTRRLGPDNRPGGASDRRRHRSRDRIAHLRRVRRVEPNVLLHTASADIATLGEMATAGGPTILLGDFNTAYQSPDYHILVDAGLTEAFREAGWGFGLTFPTRIYHLAPAFPLMRIDYVWYTDDFRATRAWVGPDAGSDHLPVLAELVWVAPEQE